ncbi:YheC/YheD family protein [Thermoflavimicrobium dichotomicum]|uniref:YheC/D like ATP-grasp n=1 Tax=Thermoflavimicrobium dichotomicum TaxID=46223 RepID=A0A1I3UXA4_9BACL|nr:YheC/YheD family protein [Thermoflavimicrobium dichotomicum]SFJ87550.1 YheC/D like ATP-grasp [Thermoflavimicrobium dichotomicum]
MTIGKMMKHKEMMKHPELRQYLPETLWLTPLGALQMLRSHSSVFIKPNHGSGGVGIIRVKRKRNHYEVRYGQKHKYVSSDSVYKAIQSYQKPSQRYLVQRGLRLAEYNGSIFDIRVYMQKPYSKWTISGMVARVAAPNRYVTNYRKGGHGEPLNKVLSNLFKNNKRKVNDSLNRMTKLSSIIAETLNKRHSGIRELGIDFGIEKNGRLWIIEANTRPGHKLFTHLPDKTMLLKIRKNKQLIRKLYY